jgi:hypothetical protein
MCDLHTLRLEGPAWSYADFYEGCTLKSKDSSMFYSVVEVLHRDSRSVTIRVKEKPVAVLSVSNG